ncbi:MAG: class A beta-lactamase [Acidobacteriota bacterium]|nr:class A beta-lactamase [Acidobacteriota bacterium]
MFALILAAAFTLPPQQSDAVIGVSAVHLESGRRISVRGSERFPMGSVYKVPITLAALHRVDDGTLLNREITIEPKDFSPGWSPLRDNAHGQPVTLSLLELLRYAVSISDNTASDALLRLFVPPSAVMQRMAQLGFRGISVNRSEKEMARDLGEPGGVERYARDVRDTTSPDETVNLLIAFWRGRDGLSLDSHNLLVRWMTETPTGMNRMKAGLPKNAIVTHKTGTMPGTVNDTGIITIGDQHYAIAIFTKASTTPDEKAEADIAEIAAAVVAYLSSRV